MTAAAVSTRIEAAATCLSWIPPQAVEGAFKLPFSMGVAHYDAPPPSSAPDVDGLLAADAIRFANQLRVWVDVTDGQITGYGMDGGGRPRHRRFIPIGFGSCRRPAATRGQRSRVVSRTRPTYA
jgi:hypothetical protein